MREPFKNSILRTALIVWVIGAALFYVAAAAGPKLQAVRALWNI